MTLSNDSVDPQQFGDSGSPKFKPIASVIIPHYDDLENLRVCLTYLQAQTMESAQYEIIVSDNNSKCGIAAVRQACEGIARVVSATVQGAGEARNVGVAVARCEVLAFTNSDCRPAREWLERGVQALNNTDVVGGRVIVTVEDRSQLTPAEAYELVFAFNNRHYVETKGYSVTANMFTRRDVFDRVGPFRVGVPEDLDWGRRASELGFRIRYVEDAVVAHPARREWSELLRKWRRLTAKSYMQSSQRPYGRLWWFARSWLILLSPLVHFLSVLHSNELSTHRQRLTTIGSLVWLRAWRFVECNRNLLNG